MNLLSRLIGPGRRAAARAASLPEGMRVYAVGDIHGRLDLLETLIAQIDADDAARPTADTAIIFLGDLVDRGPESAGVVARLLRLKNERPASRFLAGNHEEVFLRALSGDRSALKFFIRIGGEPTILSYGVDRAAYDASDYDELAQLLADAVPREHVDFLEAFEDRIVLGDYAFVHAGIRPDVPIESQKISDLRWIRDDFLRHAAPFEKLVVHGHTISNEVVMRPNRIGLDTGAYQSGRLTALGLEGTDRWLLQT